jgi:hypothetical protein
MIKKSGWRFIPIAVVVLLTVFLVGSILIKAQNSQGKLPPPGNWTLSVGVSTRPGNDSIPVDVYSVLTEADKGLTATKVSLLNRDSKDVTAVKLHWYLNETKNPGVLLLEGETQFIGIDLPAGENRELNFPVVSFAKIYKPLLRNGVLSGNYRIDIAVSEIKYADETSWKVGNPSRQDSFMAAHKRVGMPDCQNQGCVWNGDPGVQSYQCGFNHPDTICTVQTTRTCLKTRCGTQAPPTGPPRPTE